jgi:hypothetical protein
LVKVAIRRAVAWARSDGDAVRCFPAWLGTEGPLPAAAAVPLLLLQVGDLLRGCVPRLGPALERGTDGSAPADCTCAQNCLCSCCQVLSTTPHLFSCLHQRHVCDIVSKHDV